MRSPLDIPLNPAYCQPYEVTLLKPQAVRNTNSIKPADQAQRSSPMSVDPTVVNAGMTSLPHGNLHQK